MRTYCIALLLILVSSGNIYAQVPDRLDSLVLSPAEYVYNKPRPFTFMKNLPGDVWDYSRFTFRKKNALKIGAMIAGTAALVVADDWLYSRGMQLGDKLDLAHTSHQSTIVNLSVKLGDKSLGLPINAPSDLNTGMYFIGDGITHFTIAGSFWVYGMAASNNRARQTATELTEAILTTGFATQFLKHISGRQSPYTSTQSGGGLWRVFPNQTEYADYVPGHDAFPSGHLATAMATVTVIASNYPEYKFIKPLGYSMMGLLSFAMVNNGVHWVSDYPLALAMGYTFGKIAVRKGRAPFKNSRNNENSEESSNFGFNSIQVTPVYYGGITGMGMIMKF